MKHVLVVQDYVPEYRAAFFFALAQRLNDRGFSLDLAAGKSSKAQRARNDSASSTSFIPVSQVEISFFGRRLNFRVLPDLRKYDLVVFEHARRNLDLYLIMFLKNIFLPGTQIALWGHGTDMVVSRSRFEKRLMVWLTRRSDWYFAYTEASKVALGKNNWKEPRVTVLNNTVEIPESYALQTTFGLERYSNPKVLFLGGLDQAKGANHLPQVITRILAAMPNVSFEIVGDGALRSGLERRLRHFERVRFHGFLTGEEKFRLLRESTCILALGRVGLVAVESLSFGCPIMARQGGRHGPEVSYLTRDETFFELAEDIDDYTTQVLELLMEPQKIREVATRAFSNRQKLSLEDMSNSFAKGVADCLALKS